MPGALLAENCSKEELKTLFTRGTTASLVLIVLADNHCKTGSQLDGQILVVELLPQFKKYIIP